MDSLRQFVEQVLADSSRVNGLAPDVYKQLVNELTERLSKRIDRAIIESMSDQQVQTFMRLLDERPQEVQKYVAIVVPPERQQQIVLEAMQAFRKEYAG